MLSHVRYERNENDKRYFQRSLEIVQVGVNKLVNFTEFLNDVITSGVDRGLPRYVYNMMRAPFLQ